MQERVGPELDLLRMGRVQNQGNAGRISSSLSRGGETVHECRGGSVLRLAKSFIISTLAEN